MKIVITGATKGIGRAIVNLFLAKGYEMAICARNTSDLAALQSEKIHVFAADMSRKEDVLAFADFAKKALGTIDVLVNNAGVYVGGTITTEADDSLEHMINTNLYSAYHLTRALLPSVTTNGHIFNMCSVASVVAYPNGGSYSISKFALLGFSKGLREELKGQGIKVTAVLPGATWSDSWAGVDLPESRLMQAADIAEVIYAATQLSAAAVIEEIIIRPQLGDL